ncbi:MAG: deoxyribonuclease V [Armatimonadota bacterium]|nr:deoxyribonuclease V [Armatimonadota bacterium]MDR5704308.1 deoxyribonuclease V [Armatimonadota bacterium]
MDVLALHSWDLTPAEAVQLQLVLRSHLKFKRTPSSLRYVAGADVSYSRSRDVAVAAVAVLTFPELEIAEVSLATGTLAFPYVPGLLAFREVPLLLVAFRKIRTEPDAILVDGHGIAHPRRFGIACHLGLHLERPTAGCGKSLLVGSGEEPPEQPGAWTYLLDGGEQIGAILRTRPGARPVYLSPGHLLDIPGAVEIAWRCCRGYRIPEPIRVAHLASRSALPSG